MLTIGKLVLQNNLIAAPMAGYTDRVWRKIAIKCGAGLVFSEMISAEGLSRAQKKTEHYLLSLDDAKPFGIQLFGANPLAYAEAITILNDYPFDLIDINMGCPVRKVASKGAGAALMKTPAIAASIMKTVRSSYAGSLTIKIRSGWDDSAINAIELAKIAEKEGVDAIIIHPRTKMQAFHGKADWKIIAEIKNTVKIPVIGNGDIADKKDIARMFAETNCDGIMIGRAALANPAIFGTDVSPLTIASEHFGLLCKHEENRYASNMIKKFLPKYLRGIAGNKELIRAIYSKKTAKDMLQLFSSQNKWSNTNAKQMQMGSGFAN
jgi:tRNA-dihydrouridine synthase B